VSTPIVETLIASTRYTNCEVIIGEMKTFVDMIKLGEMEFDAILGMDWLTASGAYVDCNKKRIIFKMEGTPEFMFEGEKGNYDIPHILAIKATKLLK